MHKAGEDAADRGIDTRHEHISAGYLAAAFGPDVTEPVRLHVAAKRYRVARRIPATWRASAKASLQSLALARRPDGAPPRSTTFLAEPSARRRAAAARLRRGRQARRTSKWPASRAYRDLLRDLIERRDEV